MSKLIIVAAIGLAALTGSPVSASHARRHVAACQNMSSGDQGCVRGQQANRFDVYSSDGRLIGRDPDPNVRRSLQDEDALYRNGR